MSHFGFTYDQVIYEIPYRTLIMLNASVPRYKSKKDKEAKKQPRDLFSILSNQMQEDDKTGQAT